MFRDRPRNHHTINILLKEYDNTVEPVPPEIMQLLVSTQNFLSKTTPDMQQERDIWISEKAIAGILHTIGDEIHTYRAEMNRDDEAVTALNYCTETINERLQELKNNNDKIYMYYEQTDNTLKSELSSETNTNGPKI